MNKFLQTRSDIDLATKFMEDTDCVTSGISAKNWEIFQVLPYFRDGNWLDMGSSGGVVLENLVKKKINGCKVGIDLAYDFVMVKASNGIDLIRGDLTETPFPDGFFNFVCSLSVLEHEVDYEKFAKECSRLLTKSGQLFVSFDYAPEKIDTSLTKLYSLSWNILSKEDVERFIEICTVNDLIISGEVDWSVKDMVINPKYCSPTSAEYTFGILHFIKK